MAAGGETLGLPSAAASIAPKAIPFGSAAPYEGDTLPGSRWLAITRQSPSILAWRCTSLGDRIVNRIEPCAPSIDPSILTAPAAGSA